MKELFDRGVEEFNMQKFFEAHDTWEEIWRETRGPERLFYQGLIQTSVAFYHLMNGNYRGACSQFTKALQKLERYLPVYCGIETEQFVRRIRECLLDAESARAGISGGFDGTKTPRIYQALKEP